MNVLTIEVSQRSTVADAAKVAEYLDSCPVLIVAAGLGADEVDPARGLSVPIGIASDGTFAWPLALAYYVREYGVAPPQPLLDRIRQRQYRPPTLDEVTIEQLREELRHRSGPSSGQRPDAVPRGASAGDDAWG